MHRAAVLATLALLAAPCQAAAQPAEEQSPASQALGGDSAPGSVGAPGGSSGFGRHPRSGAGGPSEMPPLKPLVEPRQRLDPGALLCHTEAELKQHQAAILARLAGRTAPEPAGCHIVSQTTAVAIVEKHGQAVTEVQLAGDEPALGWTDAVIRDADPLRSPLRN